MRTRSNQLITTSIVKRLWAGPLAGGQILFRGTGPPGPPLVPALASTFLLSKTAVVLIILQNDNPYKKLYVVPCSRTEKILMNSMKLRHRRLETEYLFNREVENAHHIASCSDSQELQYKGAAINDGRLVGQEAVNPTTPE